MGLAAVSARVARAGDTLDTGGSACADEANDVGGTEIGATGGYPG